jgi:DNA-binding MarR family transcriptional regulator
MVKKNNKNNKTFVYTNKKSVTFVPTNKIVSMKIEEVIKSTVALDYDHKIILNIMYTQNLITENFNELLKPYEISGEQYNVLRILRGQKGNPANMSMIQERMIARTSNTTRLVDKLLLKQYVTRKVCPENRRKIEVLITQKGLDVLTQLDPKLLQHNSLLAKNLSLDEQQQLNTLLEKYRNQ